MADWFSELIDLIDLDSVYIMGYSDGGNTALLMALNRPDKVKRMVLAGANSHTDGYTSEIVDFLAVLNSQFVEAYLKDWLSDYKSKKLEQVHAGK